MKLKHIFFAMSASLAVLAGCQKPVDFGPEEVTIISPSETIIDVPVEGTEITVSLKATVDWALQGYTDEVRSWLSISPESGKAAKDAQTITVKVLANEDVDRKADIVFYGNIMCKAPLTISQKGAKGVFETISVKEFLDLKDTKTEYAIHGKISDVSKNAAGTYWGLTLTDETGSVACPFIENWDEFPLKNGDIITIKGVYSYYEQKNQDQLANGTIIYHEAVEAPVGTPKGSGTADDPYNATAANAKCVEVGGTASTEDYYVKGKIVSISKPEDMVTYGNATFYISDNGSADEEQFYVYRLYDFGGEKFTTSDKIKVGDEVVVKGKLVNYGGNTPEMTQGGQLVSINGETGNGGGGDNPGTGDDVTKPENITPVSIKEFLEKEVNNTDWYQLTGKIVSIASASYGNLTIEDESGSVYVYGVCKDFATSNDQSFGSLGLKVGDVLTIATLRSEYNGTAQAGGTIPAFYLSHEAGEAPSVPEGSVVLTFPDENSASNKVNGYDKPWVAKTGANSFNMVGFNNYNWDGWTYIKCGRKASASVASITSVEPIDIKVSAVALELSAVTAQDVNSIKLSVYSDAECTKQLGSDIDVKEIAVGEVKMTVPAENAAAGLYYVVTIDCKQSSANKNGFVQISKVSYLAAE